MNNQYDQIPSSLFNWLNQYAYEQLNQEQKTVVSAWFSPTEYNELHLASLAASGLHETSRKESIKENLLLHYQNVHHSKKTNWFVKEIALWKVAATLLLIGGLSYPWLVQKKSTKPLLAQVDTVYIHTTTEPKHSVVYDTVYMQLAAATKPSKRASQQSHVTKQALASYLPEQTDIKINSIHSLEAEPNQIRGNSLKHDTLLNTYGFVRL